MPTIDKLAWIHIVDRKILTTRTRGRDTYYIPGGKRDGRETDHQALIREIKEELSIDLVQDQIAFLGTFAAQADGKAEGVVVRMTCYQGPYSGDIRPAAEIDEVVWFRHRDKERSSAVDKIILDWLRDRDLIDA